MRWRKTIPFGNGISRRGGITFPRHAKMESEQEWERMEMFGGSWHEVMIYGYGWRVV